MRSCGYINNYEYLLTNPQKIAREACRLCQNTTGIVVSSNFINNELESGGGALCIESSKISISDFNFHITQEVLN